MSTCLLRLRAPPHIRASLPSSDSNAGETSDWDCSLYISTLAGVYTHLTVENKNSCLQLKALPVGLPFHQELDLSLNHRVQACISPWLFLVSFVYHAI